LLEGSPLPNRDVILSVIMTTVLLSIFAHGLTAFPGTNWYAKHAEQADSSSAENEQVEEMPVRIPESLAIPGSNEN
jgi:NhaP-type Na+/H+ or K+/H+ antiporter